MKSDKRVKVLLVFFLAGIVLIMLFYWGNKNHDALIEPEPADSLEFNNATIFGMLQLSEKIDGSRSGMTTHDLSIIVHYMQAESTTKTYIDNDFDPSDYKSLTWKALKNNILDEADNYLGLNDISPKFKSKILNSRIRITGRIYKHCMEEYYLNPNDEKEPDEALSCWAATEQHHIRLSGYSKN